MFTKMKLMGNKSTYLVSNKSREPKISAYQLAWTGLFQEFHQVVALPRLPACSPVNNKIRIVAKLNF